MLEAILAAILVEIFIRWVTHVVLVILGIEKRKFSQEDSPKGEYVPGVRYA